MRLLYSVLGIAGALLSAAILYAFSTFVMLMGEGDENAAKLLTYVFGALLFAVLLNLAAGFMDPRKLAARRMLLASAVIWPLCATLIAIAKYLSADGVTLTGTAIFIALMSAPGLLPLAAWSLARWKFVQSPAL